MSIQVMKQALEALGICESMLPEYHQWLSNAQYDLRTAIEAAEKVEPVAWMSPGKERLEFSRADTVYGSHTIPLYKHPIASQFSVGVIDADGYLYPDHPLEPGTVLYLHPQPAIPAWQPIETAPEGVPLIFYCVKFGVYDATLEVAKQGRGDSKWKPIAWVSRPTVSEVQAMLAAAPKQEEMK